MKRMLYIILIGLTLILAACGPSESEVINELEQEAKARFDQQAQEPNQTLTHFSFYLPEGYKIDSNDETNVVIRQTDQLYLLFHNPFEDKQSQTYYESLEMLEETTYLQSFKGEDYFGYIYLRPLETDYELQVGIGGTKITTQTTLDQVQAEVGQLITILTSLDLNETTETTETKTTD